MSKKKLFILPVIVLVIFSIMSISVLATDSPAPHGYKVYEENGNGDDITNHFNGKELKSGISLSKISNLQSKLDKKYGKNKYKVKDFKFKTGYDIEPITQGDTDGQPWRISLTGFKIPAGSVCLVIHVRTVNGKTVYDINFCDSGYGYIDDVTSTSPFYVYAAKKNSSAQTGDFVPAYVAMIAVALMSCGAIFAVRAKKASK